MSGAPGLKTAISRSAVAVIIEATLFSTINNFATHRPAFTAGSAREIGAAKVIFANSVYTALGIIGTGAGGIFPRAGNGFTGAIITILAAGAGTVFINLATGELSTGAVFTNVAVLTGAALISGRAAGHKTAGTGRRRAVAASS